MNPPFTLEEKQVLIQKNFEKGLSDFDNFKKIDLEKIYKLYEEIRKYGE